MQHDEMQRAKAVVGAGLHSGSSAKRPWSDTKRAFHRQACKDKEKLRLGQKLEIVERANAPSHSEFYRTQAQLAQMFNKSRSAISKILRPENVKKLRQVAATGMHLDVKRHSWRDSSVQFLALEKSVHEYVLSFGRDKQPCSMQVCQHAEKLAQDIGVPNFKGTYGWYTRFMRRHGLSADMREQLAQADGPHFTSTPPEGCNYASQASSPCHESSCTPPPIPDSAIDISSGGSLDSSASTQPEGMSRVHEGNENIGWRHEHHAPTNPISCHYGQHVEYVHDIREPAAERRGWNPYLHAGLLDAVLDDWNNYSDLAGKIMVNVKAVFHSPVEACSKVHRRIRVSIPVDSSGNPVRGFDMLYCILVSAFRAELRDAAARGLGALPRITYVDEDGDHINIDKDHELGMGIHYCQGATLPGAELTLRLQLSVTDAAGPC